MTDAIAVYVVREETERLDIIARKLYGEESGAVELLLDANPGLAALSNSAAEIPFGTLLKVPARAEPKSATPTRPWE
ncbi:tail protein X [Breoghania sp.]|uniref:tail protein X n=1 Tax=Breoghania sp. TaxID=2065378 RepID=UPI0029C9CF74|nr:tail protein X [Breoghania sp.]